MSATAPARRGDWIQMESGRAFYPLDPRPDDIEITDIAQALAQMNRYRGTIFPYSVAQHSALVCSWVAARAPEHALWALLHDAAEAYLADIPRPLKADLPAWKPIEARVMAAVCERFGLPPEEPAIVKEADFRILADEKAVLLRGGPLWSDIGEPLGVEIHNLTWQEARWAFLARFRQWRIR